ncbi:MAG TPA: HAMP domain-containing sensor histidine kinase [Ktedonobacterales bacterium]|nr:HAMP domain-containing sensor histidine kinase [Ktedonobacterales bacterium]
MAADPREREPGDDAAYLIVDEQWRILAASEWGSLVPDDGAGTLVGLPLRAVVGPEACARLQECGDATLSVENVEWALSVASFDLPGGTLRIVRTQEAQASLETVVSLIVHEVRNPLSALRALVQGLEEVVGDGAQVTAYTSRLTDEIDRLSRLLVSMAQVAGPRARPPQILVPLRELERAAATFRPELARRDIAIHVSVTPRVEPVMADGDQLQQLLVNLITNAADAMPRGGIVTLRARRDPRGRTVIAVEDTGAGMTPDEIERALRPRTSSKPGGMGLGLTVVRSIVRQCGARLRVTSSPGRGTTMAVTFPSVARAGGAVAVTPA